MERQVLIYSKYFKLWGRCICSILGLLPRALHPPNPRQESWSQEGRRRRRGRRGVFQGGRGRQTSNMNLQISVKISLEKNPFYSNCRRPWCWGTGWRRTSPVWCRGRRRGRREKRRVMEENSLKIAIPVLQYCFWYCPTMHDLSMCKERSGAESLFWPWVVTRERKSGSQKTMVVTIMMRSLPPSPVSAPCPFPLFSRRLLIIGLARKIHYACERHRLGVRGWEEGGCNNRGEREASGDCLHLYHLGGLGRKVTLSNAHRHKKNKRNTMQLLMVN